jgi:hypothetical protein
MDFPAKLDKALRRPMLRSKQREYYQPVDPTTRKPIGTKHVEIVGGEIFEPVDRKVISGRGEPDTYTLILKAPRGGIYSWSSEDRPEDRFDEV